MADTDNQTIAVMGYLASNWSGVNDLTPAVILNPAARPLDMLAWCWGELKSLHASAVALSEFDNSMTGDDVHAIYLQRLTPLTVVLDAAVRAMAMQAMAAQQRHVTAAVAAGGAV